jgi:hypothetical protein
MAKGKKTGGGSRAGVPNKATTNAREAIAQFIEANTSRFQGWLDEIAEEQGALAAFNCVRDLLEYHVPKLARTEVLGDGGGPLEVKIVRYSTAQPVGAPALPDEGVGGSGTGLPPRRTPVAPSQR